jgi:hypothetical protein
MEGLYDALEKAGGIDIDGDGPLQNNKATYANSENGAKLAEALQNDKSKLKEVLSSYLSEQVGRGFYGIGRQDFNKGGTGTSPTTPEESTGLPNSLLKAFPSGTNYGSVDTGDGGSISITGDTFRNLYERFASGVLETTNNKFTLHEMGYWEDKDGKRYGRTEILKMFQPPKGPSLMTSTDFNKFKGELTEQMMFSGTPFRN